MKRTNKLFTCLLLVALILVLTLGIVGCKKPGNDDDGPGGGNKPPVAWTDQGEQATYYCMVDGSEYFIELKAGNYRLSIAGITEGGTYTYNKDTKELSLVATSGTKRGAELNLATKKLGIVYGGKSYELSEKVEWTVSFDVGGGSPVEDVKVYNGATISRPADPELANNIFVWWFKDAEKTQKFNFGVDVITGNTTLYAKYVEKTDGTNEFNVTLINKGKEYAKLLTNNGVLYNLPELGEGFMGWWMSDSGNSGKLSRKYVDTIEIKSDCEFYAVWENDESIAVSAYDGKVEWTAVKNAETYSFSIVRADDEDAINLFEGSTQTTATSFNFDFSQWEEGEYIIMVSTANNVVGKAYVNNKALAKVCRFNTLEEFVLGFNKVENATDYYVSFVCGTETHNHKNIKLKDNFTINFEGCIMPADGIRFVVTAAAEGFMPSVSEEYVLFRALDNVSNLVHDAAEEVVKWDAVTGAVGYDVTITVDGQKIDPTEVEGNINGTSVDVSAYRGNVKVTVTPRATGYMGYAAEVSFMDNRLTTPANIKVNMNTVSWDAVKNAKEYTIRLRYFVGGVETVQELVSNGNKNSINMEDYFVEGVKEYVISVSATADNAANNSAFSGEFTARVGEMSGELTYNNGILSWNAVLGVSGYRIIINEGVEVDVYDDNGNKTGTASVESVIDVTDGSIARAIKLTKAGENTIKVVCLNSEGEVIGTDSVTKTITAYEIRFYVGKGKEPIDSLYLAIGDAYTLPEGVSRGFVFYGWFADRNAQGEAVTTTGTMTKEFADSMTNNMVTYYAGWTNIEWTISFDVGNYGTMDEDITVKAVYQANYGTVIDGDYYLVVPEATDVNRAFAGWYREPNGVGRKYADYTGKINGTYPLASDCILYAYWVEVFTYKATYNSVTGEYDTVTVSKGPALTEGILSEVTIPSRYYGTLTFINEHVGEEGGGNKQQEATKWWTVTRIADDAFQACHSLVRVNIPDTVTTAGVGSEGSYYSGAFKNCSKLAALFVYNSKIYDAEATKGQLVEVNYAPDAIYWSVDGVLYKNDSASNEIEVTCYPYGKGDSIVYIAYPVTLIPQYTFYGAKFGTIYLPASVKRVGNGAFRSCSNLTTVIFNEAEEGQTAASGLELASGTSTKATFYSNSKLTYVNFPARLSMFDANVFASCAKVSTLLVGNDKVNGFYYSHVADYDANGSIVGSIVTDRTRSTLIYIPRGYEGVTEEDGTTSYTIPSSISVIGEWAFGGTSSSSACKFNKIVIPGTVSKIEASAFAYCQSMTQLIFEGKAEDVDLEICEFAFYSCNKLEEVTLPANLKILRQAAFASTSKLKTVNVTTDRATVEYEAGAFATKVNTGNGVGTFYVNTVNLTKTVPDFAVSSVFGTSTLKAVNVEEGNPYYQSIEGILYNGNVTRLLFYPADKVGEYVVPETITEIEPSTFANKTNLTGVVLHAGIERIGGDAFKSCTGLLRIEFKTPQVGEAIVDLVIDSGAFNSCSYITEITIPYRTTEIANDAFRSCSRLNTINFEETPADVTERELVLGEYSFAYVGGTATDGKRFTEITISDRVTEIGNLCFYQCAYLEYVNVPASVTKMGYYEKRTVTVVSKVGDNYVESEEPVEMDVCLSASVFYSCNKLKEINVDPANPIYTSINGVLYSREYYPVEATNYYPYTYPTTATGSITVHYTEFESKFYDRTDGTVKVLITCPTSNSGVDGVVVIPNTIMATWYGSFFHNGNPSSAEDGTGVKTVKFSSDEIKNARNNELTIGKNSFYYSKKLETIELPKGIKSILQSTFYQCTALRNVNIPNTVSRIEPQAFYNCSVMDNIVFDESDPDNVVPLDFRNDKNTASSAAGGGIFYNCNALTTLTLPERTTELGRYSMAGTKLVTVNLPSTLQRIDYNAFREIKTLKQVNFPAQMESTGLIIEDYVFYDCTALTTINLPEGLTGIGYYAFGSCKELRSITIPSTVEEMGRYYYSATSTSYGSVFYGCKLLEKAEFAYEVVDGVKVTNAVITKIGNNNFRDCISLTEFYVPASVEIIDTYAFAGCAKLASVTFEKGSIENGSKLATIGNYAFQNTALTEFIFPESSVDVIELGSNIFDRCINLTKVYLSRNIADIGAAFKGCSNISDLTVSPKNVNFKPYQSADGKKYPLLVDLNGTSIKFVYSDIVGEFIVPEGIESIAAEAFKDQALLTSVTLPASLIDIGSYAFSYCTGLTQVVMPYDSAIKSIGTYSFEYTTSLKHIDIPGDENGVVKVRLEGYCFRFSGIESISFRGDIAFVGNYIFRNCTNLTKVNNWVPNMPFIPNYFFYGCSSLENFTIPRLTDSEGNVKPIAIKTYALYGTAIKNLVVPGYVTEIGNYAFANNVNLETVTFEDNTALVEGSFGTNVFRGCTALKKIDLSPLKELTWINTYTFRGCSSLEEVTLPEKLGNLNNKAPMEETATTAAGASYVFQNCSNLKKVNLGDNITIIGNYTFDGCYSLEEIVLPSELRIIGSYCFRDCGSLTNVDFDHVLNGAIQLDEEGKPQLDAEGKPVRVSGTGRKLENIMTYAFSASNAKNDAPAIEKLVIPNTVKTIGASAFRYSKSLKEVEFELNTNLTTFGGSYVFADCVNLEKVNLNNLPNIVYLNTYTFYNCSKLTSFTVDSEGKTTNSFPDKLVALGTSSGNATNTGISSVFEGCSSLEFVDLNKVTKLGGEVFRDCTALKSVKGIEELTIIGSYAFRNTALEEVTFGGKVTGYGYGVFADCLALKKATVEKSALTIVGNDNKSTTSTSFTASSTIYGPFAGCTALEEVTLPDNLTYIVPHTFANCTSLKSLNFAGFSKVLAICSYAFYNTSLEEVDLSSLSSLVTIGSYAFAQVDTLKRVTFPTRSALTTIETEAFSGDVNLTSVNLPASVTTLKKAAFRNCGLTEFTVPANLTTFGESVFAGNKITTYKTNSSNYRIGSIGELIEISDDGDDLLISIPNMFSGVYVFEKGTAPGSYSFSGATGLTGVELPEGMTELPEYSFAGYSGKIVLPETITSIGPNAFYEAELIDFVIPASVTSIGYRAFSHATIDKLVIPSTVERVGQYLCNYAKIREFEYNVPAAVWLNSSGTPISTGAEGTSYMFYYSEGLQKITIGEGVQYVGKYFIHYAKECDATVYFPDGMDMSQGYLFYYTKGCKFDVRLPSDMTEFGKYSFYNYATTEPAEGWNEFKMTMPNTVDTLSDYLFGGCIISDVVFSSNLKSIGGKTFFYCTRETEFVISKTVESISGYAFYYSTFSRIVFEEGRVEIPDATAHREYDDHGGSYNVYYPFYNTKIGEMILPSTLTTIGNYFLYYAKGPAKLVLPEGLKSIGTNAFYYNKGIYELYLPTTVEFVADANAFDGWTDEQTIYSKLDRATTMATWGPSLKDTSFKGNVVYNYVPTSEQPEGPTGTSSEIAIEGEVAFVDNKRD